MKLKFERKEDIKNFYENIEEDLPEDKIDIFFLEKEKLIPKRLYMVLLQKKII